MIFHTGWLFGEQTEQFHLGNDAHSLLNNLNFKQIKNAN
jgi:hypothetical protein